MSTQAPILSTSTESPQVPAALGGTPPCRPATPSNIDIEAVIQAATSSSGQLSPSSRDTRTQLFVGNLPYRVRWQDLKDLFRKAGTVLRADVSLGPDNRSRGYGTVLLASAEDAKKAIDMFHGFSWQTRTLEVRSDRIPPDLDLSNPLNALQFSKAQNSSGHTYPFIPPINGAFVNMDPLTAQIHARAAAEAQQALGLPVASPIPPSTVPSVHLSPNLSATGAGRMIFIGNLPFHCQWQELKDLFRTAGQIIRADVALGPDGRSRGFGTVLFANEVDAAAAVAMFNGYEYNGRTLKVHHDKFSQGGDALSPSFAALSGQSTHVPASPIPDLSLGRSASVSAPAGLAGPSFAQQQHLYPSARRASPGPLHMRDSHPPSESSYSHHFVVHSPPPQQYQLRNQPMIHNPEYHDFAHTPGAPLYHANQRAAYVQNLRSSIASPPPIPLRPPPVRSGGDSKPLNPAMGPAEGIPHYSDGATTSTIEPSVAPVVDLTTEPGLAAATTKSASHAPDVRNGNRERRGTDSRRPPAPGTISLPPSQVFSVNPMSPHMTRGLPITPSMPAFTFHAPSSTPPLHHHLLSPGLGPYSPPITFFNPYMNPAPGAPLHTGGQQDRPQPMFAGVNTVLGPPSLHDQMQASPGGHPVHPELESFHVPGSPHAPASYMHLPPFVSTVSPLHQELPAQSPPEPTDYFTGALPVDSNVTPLPSDMPPARTSSNEGMGSAGRGSGGTGPSTIPSSSGTSSPLGSRQEPASSRGTSNPGEGDDFVTGPVDVDSPPPGTMEHTILHHDTNISGVQHGRAKSQSPNESAPSLTLGQRIADNVNSPMGERRMSWDDLSGLQRSIARMSLEGMREAGKLGKRPPRRDE